MREIARILGAFRHAHQAAVSVLPMPGGDALGNDLAAGVAADVNHLGAGIRLLVVVGQRHRVKLAHRALAAQHAGGVLPGDGRTGFHLSPRDLGTVAAAVAALGDEVVDAAFAVFVSRIPVLHRGVLDFGVFQGNQFHHGRVQLVFIAHRRSAAFQVTDITPFLGNDQCAFKLAGIGSVDTEIGAELHRAAHAAGDVHEAAVREDRRVQGGEEIVARGHHGAQVLPHEFGMIFYRFRERAENHAGLLQFVTEGRPDRDRIEDRVHRDTGQAGPFVQWHAQLVIGLQQFGVDLVQALRPVLVRLRRGKIGNGLEVDRVDLQVRPVWLLHFQPFPVRVQTPFQ